MEIIKTKDKLRQFISKKREQHKKIALVPTMGALHQGHLSLIKEAHKHAPCVIATIFVNPTQFAAHEDLDKYPKTHEKDYTLLKKEHTHAVFVPDVTEIYRENDCTTIKVKGPALSLETEFRPHFFQGVAGVVTRLLLLSQADLAFFGEKDFQQLAVIKQCVHDLHIACTIHGVPTLRATDGLALSSRNLYLSEKERKQAPYLFQILETIKTTLKTSNQETLSILEHYKNHLNQNGFKVDYLRLTNAQSLQNVDYKKHHKPMRLLAAAWLGKTRLIDNIAIGPL